MPWYYNYFYSGNLIILLTKDLFFFFLVAWPTLNIIGVIDKNDAYILFINISFVMINLIILYLSLSIKKFCWQDIPVTINIYFGSTLYVILLHFESAAKMPSQVYQRKTWPRFVTLYLVSHLFQTGHHHKPYYMPVLIQDLDIQHHMSWSFLCSVS